jgi:hypothetical protein
MTRAKVRVLGDRGWRKCRHYKRQGCSDDIVPCAHLVGPTNPRTTTHFHWVFRDAEGDVNDPHPSVAAMPADDPRMRELSLYGTKVLTISISRQM